MLASTLVLFIAISFFLFQWNNTCANILIYKNSLQSISYVWNETKESKENIDFVIYIVSNPKKILSLSPCVSIIRQTDKKSLKCKSLDIRNVRAYICALFVSQRCFRQSRAIFKIYLPFRIYGKLILLIIFPTMHVVLFLIKKSLWKETRDFEILLFLVQRHELSTR